MTAGCFASILSFQTSLFELQTSKVVAPRIELGTTSLSARPGQPALDYHLFRDADRHFVGAYLPGQWAGRRSNPRLRFFRPPLDRLSYQPMLVCWGCPDLDTKKGSMPA